MKKILIYVLFLLIPAVNNARVAEITTGKECKEDTYTEVNLADSGLNRDVFALAVKGMQKLTTEGQLPNPNLLTIADY